MRHLLISTRKGLVAYKMQNGQWKYDALHFRGIPVCLTFRDQATGALWAFQDHGHWGVKMQRSMDFGASWTEVPAMAYPEGSEVKEGAPASLQYIWAAETDSKGRLCAF